MRVDADVVIVGGGVAGCATGLGLAARGLQVRILDRATFPREKACGEGLMPHGLNELHRLGVEVRGRPFVGIRYAIGDVHATGSFPDGLVGRGVRRRDLDNALVGACSDRVEVCEGVKVRGLSGEPGAWTVKTSDGPVTCRAVVGADGLHSPTRKALGLEGRATGRARYGARQHFRLAPGVSEGQHVEVHVLPDVGVELYLTPTAPGELNVALLLEKDQMAELRGDVAGGVRRLIERCPPVADKLVGAEPISEALAIGPLRQTVTAGATDGAVLVGDAAGFLDAITGEGMSLTLIEAAIAADVLADAIETGDLSARRLRAYDKRRHARAQQLTRLTHLILWGIRHRWLARHVVRNLGRNPALFQGVLAVNVDRAPLTSIGLGGARRLVLGF